MSALTKEGKKWINASVAITCILVGIIVQSFFDQLNEWFELEATIGKFTVLSQSAAVLVAFLSFIYIIKNKTTSTFLSEVYNEATKVVFPDKNETVRHTIGIMIGVTIVGYFLGAFDFIASYTLSFLSK
jgi:preprotein translocase subunit SecE